MIPNGPRRIASEIPQCRVGRFATILADPPWRFENRTGIGSPESTKCYRYPTLSLRKIAEMPVPQLARAKAHLYLWVVNAQLREGMDIMHAWGFKMRSQFVWAKVRQDGGIIRGGMGNYFRNAHELCLFGTRGRLPTRKPARTQPTVIHAQRREHSRKPDQVYDIIERCSPGPRLELFARYPRDGWYQWGNQLREKLHSHIPTIPGAAEPLPTTLVYTSQDRHTIYRVRARSK